MNKTRILLASVLKPINDTRMFEKLGLSLLKIPNSEIHIVGFTSPLPRNIQENIHFHPLFSFTRLSLKRLTAPFLFLRLLFRIKPGVLIIGTPELLGICLVYKLFRSVKLIYDIRENYSLNIKTQTVYAPWLKNILAGFVRATEILAAKYITGFFLAEKSYASELPFLLDKYIILENKFKPADHLPLPDLPINGITISQNQIKLLYTGTISEIYGIFDAVNLCRDLYVVSPIYSLTIIGYCPQPEILKKLTKTIENHPYIVLEGGNTLVPHQNILAALQTHHLGLLPYQAHSSLNRCVPTKLYEYLGNRLPVVASNKPDWAAIIPENQAGLLIDFKNFDAHHIHKQIQGNIFYQNKNLQNMYWNSEETKLLNWVKLTIYSE